MSRGIVGKIQLNSFADIVSGDDTAVTEVPLEDLHEFNKHPFRVHDDEKMMETVESIKKHGVLMPGIVRPRIAGGYEIISGHRRRRACELAGLDSMPVLIKSYDDDQATIIMVDSNIQREDILPSEKAKAYRMKYDAMKHQGSRDNESGRGKTVDQIGSDSGESGRTVQRYIFLSKLSDGLLELVDSRRIPFVAGVDISFLTEEEQEWVLQVMEECGRGMNITQSATIREHSGKKELTKAMVRLIISQEKPKIRRFVMKPERLAEYFPEEMTQEEIEETIYGLLENWKKSR